MIYVTDGPKSDAIRKDGERLKEKGVKTEDNTFEKDKEDKETPHVLDEFISGHYIISSIEYTFRAGQNQLGQKLSLQRREWPLRSNDI
jgi:hypothetical protein